MNLKKILSLVAVGLAGFAAGAAAGYIRALQDVDEASCPDRCECAGECSMCAGAHSVAADAQADAAAVSSPAEEPVSENIGAAGAAEDEVLTNSDQDVVDEIALADADGEAQA